MDGRSAVLVISLRNRLLIGIGAFVLVTGLAAGVVAFRWSFDESIELQDSMLVQIGALVAAHGVQPPAPVGEAVDAEALRATAVSCGEARRLMFGWQRAGACATPAATLRRAIVKLFEHFTSKGAKACAISLPPNFAPSGLV